MPSKRTHPSHGPQFSSTSQRTASPRLNEGADINKSRSTQDKKAALKKYLAALDPEKRKQVIAALAQKQKAKKTQPPKPEPQQPQEATVETKGDPSPPQPGEPVIPPRRPKRASRTPSTRTLSKTVYQRAGGIMLKRRVWQLFFMLLFLGVGFGWVAFIFVDQQNVFIIMESSTIGLAMIEKENPSEQDYQIARDQFSLALNAFTDYNKTHDAWWRRPDVQLTQRMLRVAIGWRVVGNTQNAVETFRQTALFLPEGFNSWQGDQFREEMDQFLDSEFWSEQNALELYTLFASSDPGSWGEAGRYLVEKTEQVGLWLLPVRERFQDADIVVYGAPRAISDSQDGEFVVNAEIIYKADREPDWIYIKPRDGFSKIEQQRLNWYLNEETKCILFGTFEEDKIRLNTIESIVMSRPSTVNEFNAVVSFSN